MSMLEHALRYARRGWPVFPAKPRDKTPLTKHGFKDATTDEGQIHAWWTQWPEANVAIATGGPKRLVVIDCDTPEGYAALKAHGPIPATLTVQTSHGPGAPHLYFHEPDQGDVGNRTKVIPCVDVRAKGGYVVAPPSVHETGAVYTVLHDAPIATIPDWLVELVTNPATRARKPSGPTVASRAYAQRALENECQNVREAEEGTRNDTLNLAAHALGRFVRDGGLRREDVEAGLHAAGVAAGLSSEEVDRTIASGIEAGLREPRHEPEGRRTIYIRAELAPVCDEAEAALLADAEAGIYQRSGALVRVSLAPSKKVQGVVRAEGAPLISVVSAPYLREKIDRAADWRRSTKEGGSNLALPPEWVSNTLLARGGGRFPVLSRVTESPTLRSDGTVIDASGYDNETGILYEPGRAVFPPIPRAPVMAAALSALEVLSGPFNEFPFVSPNDQAAAITALLTTVARSAFDGPAPMFAIRSPTPGTGKGLLADVVSIIGSGRSPALMTPPADDDEVRKRILAIAIAGDPVVLIDNVEGSLGSASMAAALTSTTWADRILGRSEVVRMPLTATWLATGTGVTFRGDLGRRVIPIDLDARVEHPEDRSFRQPDLRAYVREQRTELYVAALTILRAYFVAGRPKHGAARKGSYEAWDDLVRGAAIWVGLPDPCGTVSRVRADGDEELESLRTLLGAWAATFGDAPKTAHEVIEHTSSDLRAAVQGLVARGEVSAQRLGRILCRRAGRIVGKLCLERAGRQRSGAALWRVTSV